MKLQDFFPAVGGDYEIALARISSEDLLRRFIGKFLADPSYEELCAAWRERDVQRAFLAAHTLKGTAANLGLDALAGEASELTEQLRNAETFPAEQSLSAVAEAYRKTTEAIKQLD